MGNPVGWNQFSVNAPWLLGDWRVESTSRTDNTVQAVCHDDARGQLPPRITCDTRNVRIDRMLPDEPEVGTIVEVYVRRRVDPATSHAPGEWVPYIRWPDTVDDHWVRVLKDGFDRRAWADIGYFSRPSPSVPVNVEPLDLS